MGSVSFDRTTGWWSVRYYAGPDRPRAKKTLCKHPGPWSRARPPRRPPPEVLDLAGPFLEAERQARLGFLEPPRETPIGPRFREYQARVATTLRPNTTANVRVACDKFLAFCLARGVASIQGVTYAVCRDWIAARLAGGAARSTVVTERSNLMPIWAEALRERVVREDPWAAARVPGKARKEVPTAWTRDEVDRLVAVLDGWLRDLVLVGLNTGIRIGALLALRWPQVDRDAGLIRVRAASSKSGRPYEVPMSPTARAALDRRRAAAPDGLGFVFLNPGTGRPYADRTTFTRIGRAAARAGIPDHGDFNHIMRRTFATLALNAGVPLEVVSRCLDHSSLAQTERAYAHLRADRIREAMAGFDLGGPAP